MTYTTTPTRYTDDPDANIVWTDVENQDGQNLTGTPVVAIDGGAYTVNGTWLGVVGPKRDLRVPVDAVAAGLHHAFLQISGDNDLPLGAFYMEDRT